MLRYPAYTDLAFHMDDVCTNLGWGDSTQFVKIHDARKGWRGEVLMVKLPDGTEAPLIYSRSCEVFGHNFAVGYTSFCQHRNALNGKEMGSGLTPLVPKLNPVSSESDSRTDTGFLVMIMKHHRRQ